MRVTEASDRPLLAPCGLERCDAQLDTYVGCRHHCFYCYALNDAETDLDHEVEVHRDLVPRLSAALDDLAPGPDAHAADRTGRSIYIGWDSDPYQPAEADLRQTRAALELLAERRWSATVLTKSPLIVRDVDVYRRMPRASVGVSVAFRDERVRRLFEAGAPATSRRIRALRELREAGLDTYALICPVMPYLTPVRELVEDVRPYAATVWVYALAMRSEDDRNWRNVRDILRRHFPELEGPYRAIAFDPAHPYWSGLREDLERLQHERPGMDLRVEITFEPPS